MSERHTIYVLVEGETEERFIKDVLDPYLNRRSIHMRIVPFKVNTSNRGGVAHKGGVSNYTKLRKELTMVCNSHPHAIISTMFDLYGFPAIDGVDRTDAKQIEEWIHDDIGTDNLIPFIMKHEFEALLFSDIEQFQENKELRKSLNRILREFDGMPESINTNASPSHRLETAFNKVGEKYSKNMIGISVAKRIGIDNMRARCPHFNEWVGKLEHACNDATSDDGFDYRS